MSATEITSDSIIVDRSVERVYAFLHDLRNYETLMPEDVSAFSAQEDQANLKVSGLGEFSMHRGECEENSVIELIPKGKLPFKFNLHWNLKTSSNGGTEIQGKILAQLNMFMKMMAEGKLKEFVSSQANKMKAKLEEAIPNS